MGHSFKALLIACASLACSRTKAPDPSGPPAASASAHADEPEHPELPKKVRLDPEAVRDAGVKAVAVVRERLVPTLSLAGEIAADPDRTSKLASPVPGRIESVAFTEGVSVKKGDVLVVIRVPELGKIRGAHAATAAKAKAARANATRLKDLFASKLTSEQSYLDAKAEADALEAETKALGDELAAVGAGTGAKPFLLSLRATSDGVVIHRDAVVGQPVASDQVLGTISDLSQVWFLARVFEQDLGKLREKAASEVRLNAYPKEFFNGTLDYIGQQIDPIARTVIARVRLANVGGRLRIGLFGAARISLEEASEKLPVLVVPRTAITEVAGKTVVFVMHADGDFELHEVVLGDSAPGKVAIVSGLREGEQVVSEGVFTLKSVVLKSTLGEGD